MIKKNRLYLSILISILCLLVVSCNKLFPFNFSDANNVESFRIADNKTPKVEINKNIVINPNVKDTTGADDYGEIILSVDNGVDFFPLIFTADIIVSANADIRSWPKELALSFEGFNDTKSFYVVSASGIVKKWIIRIVDKTIPPEAEKSNNTTIKSFSFTTFTEGTLQFNATDLEYTEDSIYFPYDQSQPLISVSFIPTIELPTGASFTAGYTAGSPITINADGSAFPITIVAEDGKTTKTYYIALKPFILGVGSGEAEITDFSIRTIVPSSLSIHKSMKGFIDKTNRIIYVVEYNNYDFGKTATLAMQSLTISPNATLPTTYNKSFVFSSFNDVKTLTITAENGSTKTWKIQLLYSPQIAGSDFENWKSTAVSSYPNFVELNSPGTWAINNNKAPSINAPSNMVNPSTDVFTGIYSAKLTTIYEYIYNTLSQVVNPILAGNLFLGSFALDNTSSDQLLNPLHAETWGIPFAYAPKFVHVAMKYTPGPVMINANISLGTPILGNQVPKYAPIVIDDKDSCEIWIKVQDAGGNEIGNGYFATGSTIPNWTELYIPIIYTATTSAPAKFLMHCTSSKKGGEYKGAPGLGGTIGSTPTGMTTLNSTGEIVIYGSTLFIDNVELIYLPPAITSAYPPLPK